ncbi:hypothetical protein HKD37_05G012976 [Glycine soja]
MENCLVKLKTKFREDPTVNEGWEAFLRRQLHVVFSRSFIKRLPLEASLRDFFEKLDPYLSTPLF